MKIPGKINLGYSVFEQFVQLQLLDELISVCEVSRYNNIVGESVLKINFTVNRPYFSRKYHLEILYHSQSQHGVYITHPKIIPSAAIHMYPDHRLCLFFPPDISPYRRLWIAKDLIPLAFLWVHHYEEWLTNGNIWLGNEAPGHWFLMQQLQYQELKALR